MGRWDGENKIKGSILSANGIQTDFSLVGLDDEFGIGQADTRAIFFAVFCPVAQGSDTHGVCLVQTLTAVAYSDQRVAWQQLYPGINPGTIIQGIADQVIQYAFDVLGIAKDLGLGQVDVGGRVGPPFYIYMPFPLCPCSGRHRFGGPGCKN